MDAELIDLLAHLYARLRPHGRAAAPDQHRRRRTTRAEYTRELRDHLLGDDVFDAEQRARIEINPMRAFDWDGAEIARSRTRRRR